ncbi:MAG: hypothetical protein MZV63_40275 [Marinilabiliales bacterium]|nr:hypothetical protein [Marinilabiliales bacterium]
MAKPTQRMPASSQTTIEATMPKLFSCPSPLGRCESYPRENGMSTARGQDHPPDSSQLGLGPSRHDIPRKNAGACDEIHLMNSQIKRVGTVMKNTKVTSAILRDIISAFRLSTRCLEYSS